MRGYWRTSMVAVLALSLASSWALATDIGDIVKMLQAKYGKYENLIKDLTLNLEVTVQDGKNTMVSDNVMYYKEPKFRMDSKVNMGEKGGAMTTSVIYDGTEMWMISMMGAQKLADKDQMKYQREKSWKWWGWLTEGGKVTGSEKIGEYDCWVIEFPETQAKDDQARPAFSKLWLDKELLVQVKAEAPYEKNKKAVFLYSDIKPAIGKMEMPHKTETFVDGKLVSTAVIKSIEYNKNLPDDLFSAAKAKSENKGMGGMLKGLVPGSR